MASARLSGAWQATWISKETAPAETVDVIFPLFFLLCIGFQVYSDPSKCRNLFELLKLVALYKRIARLTALIQQLPFTVTTFVAAILRELPAHTPISVKIHLLLTQQARSPIRSPMLAPLVGGAHHQN